MLPFGQAAKIAISRLTMGSGTTGVAAKLLGRGFIGIELDSKHYSTAVGRVLGD